MATAHGLVFRVMALSMQTRNIALALVIVVAAVVQGCVVLELLPPNHISRAIDRNDDDDFMREKLQQAGLDAVTHVRKMDHACKPPDALGQWDYS
ncbi:hypothetical protein [Xanthomonas tesorieronis]|uniref:hypothetical protein n=1 Tax=Xanthomonas tesorieronis TaxID=3160839 RepID=UPI003513AAB7